jgi:tRNA (guanine37-N1)-methyltransferase
MGEGLVRLDDGHDGHDGHDSASLDARRGRVRNEARCSPGPCRHRRLMPLEVDVLTLFPAMVDGPLRESIPGRILEQGIAIVRVHDLRTWGLGRHRTVDDYTYGGGAGMVLRPEPVAAALAEIRRPDSTVILLDPAGRVFRQAVAHDLATRTHLVFLCPRYEGVDERIRAMVDLELSIGDYVLTGGELAALVIIDAVLRLLPGAIDKASIEEESFAAGLLEYPQYTRPASFDGATVPPILVSGHHEQVRKWRLRESLRRTLQRRPDLLEGRELTKEERTLLAEVRDDRDAAAAGLQAADAGDPNGVPDVDPA